MEADVEVQSVLVGASGSSFFKRHSPLHNQWFNPLFFLWGRKVWKVHVKQESVFMSSLHLGIYFNIKLGKTL